MSMVILVCHDYDVCMSMIMMYIMFMIFLVWLTPCPAQPSLSAVTPPPLLNRLLIIKHHDLIPDAQGY